MPDTYFFSVVIPTYNRADYILKAIESCLQQTYSDVEVIVIDDGSTDNTRDIVSQLEDHRVRFFRKENGERGAARNFGVLQSRGKYVTFLDSDDYLRENHLDVAYRFIHVNKFPAVIATGYDVVDKAGRKIYPWKNLPSPVNRKLEEGNFLSCSGVFLKNEIAREHRFNEHRSLSGSEDYELWIRLSCRFPILVNNVSTACLVDHQERSVLNFAEVQLLNRITQFEESLQSDSAFFATHQHKKKKIFAFQRLYIALHLVLARHKKEGLTQWLISFVRYPPIITNLRYWVVLKKMVM